VICTSTEGGRGACYGDSGGPLLVGNSVPYQQVGIMSYGDIRCGTGVPDCFTNLAAYEDWIRDAIDDYDVNQFH